MNELEQLRAEAEQLKNAIRVRYIIVQCWKTNILHGPLMDHFETKGRPQDRLRHDVGAGGRHHGANRTHSNAYETHPSRSSFQNLRHALGRRIEV